MTPQRATWLSPTSQAPTVDEPLILGMLHGRTIEGDTFDCVVQLLLSRPDLVQGMISTKSGPSLFFGRNRMTEEFLADPKNKWLYVLDSDMTFTPDQFDRQIRTAKHHGIKILGSLAWISGADFAEPGNIKANLWHDIGGPSVPMSFPLNTVCEVKATGAACVLIHRSVFEDIGEYGWWDHIRIFNKGTDRFELLGEDVSFCKRAGEAGHKVYVDTGNEFGHIKSQTLDSRSLERGESLNESPDEEIEE